jgi:hypothetical protein
MIDASALRAGMRARHHGRVPGMRAAAVLVVAAGALGACRSEPGGGVGELELARVESLPGFRISVPGQPATAAASTPAAGRRTYRHGAHTIHIGWQVGRIPADQIQPFAEMAAFALGPEVDRTPREQRAAPLIAPDHGTTFTFGTKTGGGLVGTTVVECVRSNVVVTVTSFAARDADATRAAHDRLVATLRCGSEADAQRFDPGPPAFDQGDHIGYLLNDTVYFYASTRGETWAVRPMAPGQQKIFEYPELVKKNVTGGVEILDQERLPHSGAESWVQIRAKVVVDGRNELALLGVLACPGVDYSVFYQSGMPDQADPRQLERIHCPPQGIAVSEPPSIANVFGAACDKGNGLACVMLASFAEHKPALLPGLDPAGLRARACKLGLAEACP